MKRNFVSLLAAIICLFGVSAAQQDHATAGSSATNKAIAVISPTKGNTTRGIVTFSAVEGGIKVVAHLTGLTPGKHGFHIHEYGDCSADDGSSAGGHFNPTGMQHSMPSSDKRHEGDMGNIEAGKSGEAHLEYIDHAMSFSGEKSIIGHAVIVHEKEDDLKSQPAGAAGSRIGYGVIGIAAPEKK